MNSGDRVRSPSLSDFAARAIDAWMRGVFQARPGKITKWDTSKQKADVQPLIKLPYRDEEDARQVESAPIVSCVPVIFPGAGPVRITFPLSDGTLQIEGTKIPATTGLLIWCDCSIDKWLSGRGGEVDPEFDHRNGQNDAVFIAGFNPFGAPLGDVPSDYMSIGFDGGLQIKIEKSVVTVAEKNATQVQFVALENLVKQELTKLNDFIIAHTHPFSWTFGGGSGTTLVTTDTNTVGEVAAKNLKAEQ